MLLLSDIISMIVSLTFIMLMKYVYKYLKFFLLHILK